MYIEYLRISEKNQIRKRKETQVSKDFEVNLAISQTDSMADSIAKLFSVCPLLLLQQAAQCSCLPHFAPTPNQYTL